MCAASAASDPKVIHLIGGSDCVVRFPNIGLACRASLGPSIPSPQVIICWAAVVKLDAICAYACQAKLACGDPEAAQVPAAYASAILSASVYGCGGGSGGTLAPHAFGTDANLCSGGSRQTAT